LIREPEDLPELMMCVMQRELRRRHKHYRAKKLGAALQVAKGLEGCFGFSGFSICGIAFHGEMAAEMYWQTCFCRFVLECGAGFVWLAARYY
jgi:hypothetical protein